MFKDTRLAFERLLNVAKSNTGQAKRAANFALDWWNADSCGGFDVVDVFNVGESIAADLATVFGYVASRTITEYPEEYRAEIEDIIRQWRPMVWEASQEQT
jgi:hypothetical protein